MGLCVSENEKNLTPDERRKLNQDKLKDLAIEKEGLKDFNADQLIRKLLLIGGGESGKSTLFKHMTILYGKGICEEDRKETIEIVASNTLRSMATLAQKSTEYSKDDPKCQVDEKNNGNLRTMLEYNYNEGLNPEIGACIKALWDDPAIKRMYTLRSGFQLIDTCNYFFENVDRFLEPNYLPNNEDMLKVRSKTTGILNGDFMLDGCAFKIFDVGGQRNERKKWIHCFENVTAVLFVAAISEFDQKLYEDNKTNRIVESLNVFEELSNNQWFSNTTFILFLNKSDLLAEKLERVKVKDWFDDYDGDNSVKSVYEYFLEKYAGLRKTDAGLIPHLTCATNEENVIFVFKAVVSTVVKGALDDAGIL